jgi:hypothetical protein
VNDKGLALTRCSLFFHYQKMKLVKFVLSGESDYDSLFPENVAKKMLFQSLYLRLRSIESRHLEEGKYIERRKQLEEKLWLISKLSMSNFQLFLNGYVSFNGCL